MPIDGWELTCHGCVTTDRRRFLDHVDANQHYGHEYLEAVGLPPKGWHCRRPLPGI